eukprot:Clim_evm1s77 gene=Clim_evmTU1s77
MTFQPLFNRNATVVRDPVVVREVLKNVAGDGVVLRSPTLKRGFAYLAKGLLVLEGDEWRRHRHLVLPAFNTARLRPVAEITYEVCVSMGERWRRLGKDAPINMHAELNKMAMQVLLKAVFSLDYDIVNNPDVKLRDAMARNSTAVGRRSALPKWTHRFLDDNKQFDDDREYVNGFITNLIRERQATNERSDRDVLALLINQAMEGKITEDEMVHETVMFFKAGHETTATALTWVMFRLSQDKELTRKLREEVLQVAGSAEKTVTYDELPKLELLDAVIKETLRLHPVAPVTSRELLQDIKCPNGMVIPAGATVVCNFYGLNRHPKYWKDPEEFKPERWMQPNFTPVPGTFLPFGSGPQSCIGERLARTEMKAALASLVREFDFELDAQPEKLLANAVHAITLGLKKGCPVRVIPVDQVA